MRLLPQRQGGAIIAWVDETCRLSVKQVVNPVR
jgi:hypothetical protein